MLVSKTCRQRVELLCHAVFAHKLGYRCAANSVCLRVHLEGVGAFIQFALRGPKRSDKRLIIYSMSAPRLRPGCFIGSQANSATIKCFSSCVVGYRGSRTRLKKVRRFAALLQLWLTGERLYGLRYLCLQDVAYYPATERLPSDGAGSL